VTSALGGSITSPKSQKGSSLQSSRVLSASKAAQPPPRDCMPSIQRAPRAIAASTSARPGAPAARSASTLDGERGSAASARTFSSQVTSVELPKRRAGSLDVRVLA